MRSILVLILVLFFGVVAQAQRSAVEKVIVIKETENSIVKLNNSFPDNHKVGKELSLLYKRRRSAVKKHLHFAVRRNRIKVA
ncbi:hypothetical protein [Maribacter halichondriae]|uniref:hypothetical protein n=1 Tax=Maribacter halichondriae TaxID=2980554 RepID=UPI00235A3480|nr:hypothetical protein [Maribacter sp. Hal144]